MSIYFYRDDAGAVGDRHPAPGLARVEAADHARRQAFAQAETLTALLDRHAGDSGDDADAIEAITADIEALVGKVRALLGEPR